MKKALLIILALAFIASAQTTTTLPKLYMSTTGDGKPDYIEVVFDASIKASIVDGKLVLSVVLPPPPPPPPKYIFGSPFLTSADSAGNTTVRIDTRIVPTFGSTIVLWPNATTSPTSPPATPPATTTAPAQ